MDRKIDEKLIKELNRKIDTLAYRTFNKIRKNYSEAKIVIRDKDLSIAGLHLIFKSHRDFVEHKFREQGIVILRWNHNYRTLNTEHPELGLVYLANDSVLDPGLEVIALVDHNCKRVI